MITAKQLHDLLLNVKQAANLILGKTYPDELALLTDVEALGVLIGQFDPNAVPEDVPAETAALAQSIDPLVETAMLHATKELKRMRPTTVSAESYADAIDTYSKAVLEATPKPKYLN